uniref:Uncharacterized protein n=1 Tax=Nephromyces sp. ex Molgula occidentalis TaxID=2544991 RepID=A0A5C1H7L9_9APIC|nr:hypothetical protein [Nephromyces sp. ex Molgula occidentalis]
MIYKNISNKKFFYKTKQFKNKLSDLKIFPFYKKFKVEFLTLFFDKTKVMSYYTKGILIKKRKSNLFLKSTENIKIPLWSPKIKNIKIFF